VPETAPNLKWVVTDRLDTPLVFMSIRRSLTGKVKKHVLSTVSGVLQLTNYRYTVKVQAKDGDTLEQRIAALKAMNGKTVYLCDSYHAVDGASHVADSKTMIATIGEFAPVGPGLPYFLVDVSLEDASW
jgi:hypothetical protein